MQTNEKVLDGGLKITCHGQVAYISGTVQCTLDSYTANVIATVPDWAKPAEFFHVSAGARGDTANAIFAVSPNGSVTVNPYSFSGTDWYYLGICYPVA